MIQTARWSPPTFALSIRVVPEAARLAPLDFLVTAYAALLPFQVQVAQYIRLAPADCCLLLAVVLAPAQLRYRKETWSLWHYSLLLMFALSTFAVAARTGVITSWVLLNKDAGLLILYAAYAMIASAVTSWARLRAVLRAFIVSVVLQNLAGIAAFVAANLYGVRTPLVYEGVRLCGMLVDPNAYGGLLVSALVLAEGACYGPAPLFQPRFHFFCRASLALGLLLTFSRTAWISLGFAFLFVLVLRFRTAIRAAFAFAAGAAVTLIVMGQRFWTLFMALAFRPAPPLEVAKGRAVLARDGLAVFSQHPVFGAGLGNFIEAEGEILHNTALWFLTEFGIVGLSVYMGFAGWFLVKGRRSYQLAPDWEKPVVLGLMLAHIAMLGLAMGIEALYQRHWWLMFALIASSYSIARRQSRPSVA